MNKSYWRGIKTVNIAKGEIIISRNHINYMQKERSSMGPILCAWTLRTADTAYVVYNKTHTHTIPTPELLLGGLFTV